MAYEVGIFMVILSSLVLSAGFLVVGARFFNRLKEMQAVSIMRLILAAACVVMAGQLVRVVGFSYRPVVCDWLSTPVYLLLLYMIPDILPVSGAVCVCGVDWLVARRWRCCI